MSTAFFILPYFGDSFVLVQKPGSVMSLSKAQAYGILQAHDVDLATCASELRHALWGKRFNKLLQVLYIPAPVVNSRSDLQDSKCGRLSSRLVHM